MTKQRTTDAYRSIAGSFEGGSDDAPRRHFAVARSRRRSS